MKRSAINRPQNRATRLDLRGFTIMELMIVVAILFLLVGLALVAMRAVKKNADRLQSTNALKQMMSAYIAYSTDHKGRLMPGYIDAGDISNTPNPPAGQLYIPTKLKSGHILNAADTSSYVWRLAPYLDHNWQVMFTDYRSSGIMNKVEDEYGAGDASGVYGPFGAGPTDFGIADYPSYGLNSIFLGGDSMHGPVPNLAPWKALGATKPLAITRMSDAKDPAKLVVFAPNQNPPLAYPAAIEPDDITKTVRRGYMELRSPMFNYTDVNGTNIPQQWGLDAGNDGRIQSMVAGNMGVPIDRMGDDKIAVGHLDGSVDTEFLGRLAVDMTLWDPRLVSPN